MRTHEIDWSGCESRIICDGEILPSNITTLKVDAFSADALRTAVELITAPVQVVQIEASIDPQVLRLADTLMDLEEDDLCFNGGSPQSVQHWMRDYFGSLAQEGYDPKHFDPLQKLFMQMAHAVSDNYGETALSEAFVLRDDAEHSFYSFHSHVVDDHVTGVDEKGFYLTAPLNDESTVFVDTADISEGSSVKDAFEAEFINPKPILWQAKPNSLLLFATKGHEHGPSFHASPIGKTRRVIPIVNFKVGLEDGARLSL